MIGWWPRTVHYILLCSLHFLLVLLLGEQSLLDATTILLDAALAVDRSEVDEIESVKEQDVLDLTVQRRVGRETRRVIHLQPHGHHLSSELKTPRRLETQRWPPLKSINRNTTWLVIERA